MQPLVALIQTRIGVRNWHVLVKCRCKREVHIMNLEIANKLVELRKKNGYSQEELAEKLGLSR